MESFSLDVCSHSHAWRCFFMNASSLNTCNPDKARSPQGQPQPNITLKRNRILIPTSLKKSPVYCRSSWRGESGGDIVIHIPKISEIMLQTSPTLPHVSHCGQNLTPAVKILSRYFFWPLYFKKWVCFLVLAPHSCPHTAHNSSCSDK